FFFFFCLLVSSSALLGVVFFGPAGGLRRPGRGVQSQPQQKQVAKQLSETLSLNKKIQNRAGDVTQWPSDPECNPWDPPFPPKKSWVFQNSLIIPLFTLGSF
ncbi:hypothetical protein H1C71_009481, partial [Ictidomys tridecemlineatus]